MGSRKRGAGARAMSKSPAQVEDESIPSSSQQQALGAWGAMRVRPTVDEESLGLEFDEGRVRCVAAALWCAAAVRVRRSRAGADKVLLFPCPQ